MANGLQENGVDAKAKVKSFIVNNFLLGADDGSLSDDDSFLEKGVIDSTGVFELVGFIEETFGFKMTDEDLVPDNLDSLNKLNRFISEKRAG